MGALKIRIDEDVTSTTFQKTTTHRQPAKAITGAKYVIPLTLKVQDETGYKHGEYVVTGGSYRIGEYGLELGNIEISDRETDRAQIEIVGEVETSTFDERTTHRQDAYLIVDAKAGIGIPFKLRLDDPKEAYRPGIYDIDASSYKLAQYGRLQLTKIKLTAAVATMQQRPTASEPKVA